MLTITAANKLLFYRISFFSVSIVILFLTLINPSHLVMLQSFNDKLEHASAFFVLTLLANKSFVEDEQVLIKTIALLAFGLFIEWAQSLTLYRDAEWLDVAADLTGIIVYWITIKLLSLRFS